MVQELVNFNGKSRNLLHWSIGKGSACDKPILHGFPSLEAPMEAPGVASQTRNNSTVQALNQFTSFYPPLRNVSADAYHHGREGRYRIFYDTSNNFCDQLFRNKGNKEWSAWHPACFMDGVLVIFSLVFARIYTSQRTSPLWGGLLLHAIDFDPYRMMMMVAGAVFGSTLRFGCT
uniref:Uncharacterized protein n=1 Tax=Anopheles culicifacies TaxID=139723 RepID=A0A182LYS3_9DIPT